VLCKGTREDTLLVRLGVLMPIHCTACCFIPSTSMACFGRLHSFTHG